MTQIVTSLRPTPIKTFEIDVDVTGFLEGTINDWPSHIQDGIYEALEKKAQEEELMLVIVYSACKIDYGDDKTKDRIFLHVIASEVVAADERDVNKQEMQNIIDSMMKGIK